jgi:ketosteroid isomerase-like protein
MSPRRITAMLLIWLVAVVATLDAQQGGRVTGDPEQAVRAFLVPFSNGDRAGFMLYFAENATVFLPGGPFPSARVSGKANIERAFGPLPGPQPGIQRPALEPQDLHGDQFDSTAIVTFHLVNDARRGRRTFVLRRDATGWLIVHLHASNLTPEQ